MEHDKHGDLTMKNWAEAMKHIVFRNCGWETCTEYRCTPTKVFLKFSQSLRRPPTVAMWLKAQAIQLAQGPIKPTGSIYRAQLGVKGAAASASWWGPPGRDSVVV